jgi:hypothetical protein
MKNSWRFQISALYQMIPNWFARSFINLTGWISKAWQQGWHFIFTTAQKLSRIMVSRELWLFTLVVGILWMLARGPQVLNVASHLDEWSTYTCVFKDVTVFIHTPRYTAPGDKRAIEITVQNQSDLLLGNLLVAIYNSTGWMVFDKSNVVVVDTLKPYETVSSTLDFGVPNNQNIQDIVFQVKLISANITAVCQQEIILTMSNWRRVIVVSDALPKSTDTIAKLLGYTASFVTGILAITGRFIPVGKAVVEKLGLSPHDLLNK